MIQILYVRATLQQIGSGDPTRGHLIILEDLNRRFGNFEADSKKMISNNPYKALWRFPPAVARGMVVEGTEEGLVLNVGDTSKSTASKIAALIEKRRLTQ